MAKMYQEVGDKSAVLDSMGKAKDLLADISELGEELCKLKNGRSEVSAEVDAYLKRGRIGMGITNMVTPKKQKTDATDTQQKESTNTNHSA